MFLRISDIIPKSFETVFAFSAFAGQELSRVCLWHACKKVKLNMLAVNSIHIITEEWSELWYVML